MNDERELGIKITGDIGDIQDKLSTLVDSMGNINDKTVDMLVNVHDSQVESLSATIASIDSNVIDIPVNTTSIEQLSTAANAAANSLGEIPPTTNDINTGLNTINTQILVEAASAASALGGALIGVSSDATGLASDFGQIASAADLTSQSVNNIDSGSINEAASAASALGTNFEEAANEANKLKNETDSTSESTSAFSGVLSGISGALTSMSNGASSAVSQVSSFTESLLGAERASALLGPEVMIAVAAIAALGTTAAVTVGPAGEFTDSWLRLGQAVDEGSESIQELQGNWIDAINTMKDETGRSAGLIREHIISMGLIGIESKDMIVDAFSGISAAAFVTGNSIDTIEQAFKRIVSSGLLSSRQLIQFGITTDDIFQATGMTMDQVRGKFQNLDVEGRTALLNLILAQKYGETANNAYRMSWQHVNDALNAAWRGLTILVGQMILPIVLPAIEGLTGVINGLSWVIGTISKRFNDFATSVGGTRNAIAFLFGPITGLLFLMNPLIAVVGVVADNWGRLSGAVERFFTMIKTGNWGGAAQEIMDQFKWAADSIWAYFADIPTRLGELSSKFIDSGKDMINWIVSGLTSLADWLDEQLAVTFSTGGESGAMGLVDGFMDWLDDNGWKIGEIVGDTITQVLPLVLEVIAKVILVVGAKLVELTLQTLANLLNEMDKFFKELPGKAFKWGQDILQSLVNGLMDKMGPFKDILKYISDHWPKSPPKIGPLSEITSAGMGSWISEVMQGGIDAAGTFNLNNIAIPAASTAGVVNQNRIGGKTEITVDMRGAVVRNESDAEKYGRIAGQAAAKEIDGDAINNGVSVINYLR